MKKKVWQLLLVVAIFIFSILPIQAESSINVYLFYGTGCPHCALERDFLKQLAAKYPQVQVKEFEVYYNQQNNALFRKVAQSLGVSSGGVPFLIIGDDYVIGFAEGITSQEIEAKVIACTEHVCSDRVSNIMIADDKHEASLTAAASENQATSTPVTTISPTDTQDSQPKQVTEKKISVPFFGQIEISKFSLPVLTFVLAFLDGFNPCAMWTLLFLISLLLGMKDRKRMWILGSAFIVSSSVVYFLFLSAWLNLFLFLGFLVWVRTIIGVVALGAGGYYLRDYWVNKKGGCGVMGNEKRQRIFKKIEAITKNRRFYLALGGIVLLAIAVNMVELICSAGLPAIYTQILSLSQLPTWQYYLYLMFYILVFMLDDLFIFFTAMITLQAVGVQSKYSRLSHLVGGFLMLLIGLLLLFKPEILMFG